MSSRRRFLIYLAVLGPVGIVLVIYGYIGSFNRLIADNFCSYYYAEKFGLLRSIWYWRLNWSGRYSAYAFDWLIKNTFGTNISTVVLIILILWIAAFVALIHISLGNSFYSSNRIYLPVLLGTVAVFLILTNSPDTQQSLIWLDGFRAYTLPLILATYYASFYLYFIKKIHTKKQLLWASIITFLFCFLNGGLSETFAVFQIALLAYCILYYLSIKNAFKLDKYSIILLAGFISSLLSLFVIISAPGNLIRQGSVPPPGLFIILKISIIGYLDFIKEILSTPGKIIGFIGSILLFTWAGSIYTGQFFDHKKNMLMLVSGGLILSFICFPPGAYGYGEPPPGRVIVIPLFIMYVLFLVTSFVMGNYLIKTMTKSPRISGIILSSAILVLAVSATINASMLYNSRRDYIDFAKKWDATDTLISNARQDGKKTVYIPAMVNWARLDHPNENPAFWVTECYSFYYGIQVIGPPY